MNRRLKEWLRGTLRRVGYEVRRVGPHSVPGLRIARLLDHHAVDLVLDVGANRGQYATQIRDAGYRGRIVSFEPLAAAHQILARAAASDVDWEVAPRQALGAAESVEAINVAANSVSSSLLPMLDRHARAAPDSTYIGSETVRVTTLDAIAPRVLREARAPYLKIDTQGSEAAVLDGGAAVIERLCGVQLELSLVPLYKGAPSFEALVARMIGLGFEIHALLPGFSAPASGQMLQVDGIFFRR